MTGFDDTDAPPIRPLTTTVSLGMKVGLPNYSSADLFISISGVSASTTEEEMEEILDTGRIAYDKLKARVKEHVRHVQSEMPDWLR